MRMLSRTRNWLLIFICLANTSLVTAQKNLSRKDANSKVVELKELVRDLERSVKTEERQQRKLIGEFDREIEKREQEISRLKKLLYGPFIPGSPTVPPTPPPPAPTPLPIPGPGPGTNFPDPAPLYAQIADLQREVDRLKGQNQAQRVYIEELEETITDLKVEVDSLQEVIIELKGVVA